MSLYTRLAASTLFPFHERLKGHASVAKMRALERSQWWSREELERHRIEELRRFLMHAGRHVPYYRRLFGEIGLDPARIAAVSDLDRVPPLSKQDIRIHLQELISEAAGPLKRYGTGGSSGDPLVFFIGKDRTDHDVAAKWRATRWWDVDIGDRELVFWGSPIELTDQDQLKAVRDFIFRTRLLPTSQLSEEDLDRYINEIQRFRPRMLFGYPSAIARIATHAERRRFSLDQAGLKVIFVTAERLYEEQRMVMERVFSSSVANGYGGRDSGFIAHQCREGGLHISAEDVIVEIIDNDGRSRPSGEAGEIAVTHLATKDFPFIRYRTGDIGVLEARECACGRVLPLIKEIQGRSNDFVVALNGTVMHGSVVNHIFRLAGIQQFKVVQESLELTRVQVVPGPGFHDKLLLEIEHKIKERLGQGVKVTIECTEAIASEKSGKYRYIISHVMSR
jgi:phenylacetate-coenzyme A ligase PaaK-like adenylate-forming protein